MKFQGNRLELREIESAVEKWNSDLIAAAAVINAGSAEKQKLVLAINKSLEESQIKMLLSFLKQKLPNYAIPSEIYLISEWPTNLSGKTDRKQITTFLCEGKAVSLFQ